jgi:23S rRNA pseudouridine2605 synthase
LVQGFQNSQKSVFLLLPTTAGTKNNTMTQQKGSPGRKSTGFTGPNRKQTFKRKSHKIKQREESERIRLNKYIANAGVCSRREADKLIQSGVIKVNGKVVTSLGIKVSAEDVVKFDNQVLRTEKKYYVLLNKPKGYITTTEDPHHRKTVMQLVKRACKERIYPVGRLDRETTGLLLLTNDGSLAKKLTHPKHNVRKIYHIVLDKSLKKADFLKIQEGLVLDDGPVTIDKLAYVSDNDSRKEIGVELHSGRNRIVRRIFESLGYKVIKLDRVVFAGLTKKDVPRGKWRYLSEKELNYLKMI